MVRKVPYITRVTNIKGGTLLRSSRGSLVLHSLVRNNFRLKPAYIWVIQVCINYSYPISIIELVVAQDKRLPDKKVSGIKRWNMKIKICGRSLLRVIGG
jgi:hypothetical protein